MIHQTMKRLLVLEGIWNGTGSGQYPTIDPVLRCTFETPDDPGAELQLAGASIVLGHDPRLVETRRTFVVHRDRLQYRAEMATRTTPVPKMILHLTANLTRKASP